MYGTKFGDIRPLVCKKDEGLLFYPSRGFDITVSRSLTRYPRGMDDGKLNRVKKKRGKKTEPSLKFSSRLIIEIQLWHSFLPSFFFQSTLGLSDFFLSLIYNAFRTERERDREGGKNSKLKLPFVKKYAWKLLLHFDWGPITGESNQIPILCRKIDARRNKFPNGKAEEDHYWGRSLDKVK